MNKDCVALMLSASLLTSSTLAGTVSPVTAQPDWMWEGTLNAGPAWSNDNETQSFNLTPDTEKNYVANKFTRMRFNGELFVGLQQSLSSALQGQLGLTVVATSNVGHSGVIWEDADPDFSNYTYEYKIQHTHVAVKGKILADAGFGLMTPWISGSLGVGLNNAHSFKSTPTIVEAVPTPDFASHTKIAFTYTLGAGVQKALNSHWQVGVGYEFANWGKSSLGRAEGQTLNTGLALHHIYTNSLMFTLTYLA
jgi:opacity protein-like surface antigen